MCIIMRWSQNHSASWAERFRTSSLLCTHKLCDYYCPIPILSPFLFTPSLYAPILKLQNFSFTCVQWQLYCKITDNVAMSVVAALRKNFAIRKNTFHCHGPREYYESGKISLLFQHYSGILLSTYYSQNYGSIIQRVTKVKKCVVFSRKLLHCRDRALPPLDGHTYDCPFFLWITRMRIVHTLVFLAM